MARDIEEFLRKAAERRRQAQQRAAAPPPPQRPPDLVIEDETVEAAPPVRERLSAEDKTAKFDERASHLGERIEMAHEKRERELRKFDHEVSSLKKKSVTDELAAPSEAAVAQAHHNLAAEIAQMFRTPASLRQAIILSEVLQRPEHRW